MKKWNLILPLALALVGCSTVKPGTVVVGVQVTQKVTDGGEMPMTFIRSGRYWPWLNPGTDYHTIPIREQREVWSTEVTQGDPIDDSLVFQAKDGDLTANVGLVWAVGSSDEDIRKVITNFPTGLGRAINGRVRDSTQGELGMCAQPYTVIEVFSGDEDDCTPIAKVKCEEDAEGNQVDPTCTPAAEVKCKDDIRKEVIKCAETSVREMYAPLGLQIRRVSLNKLIPPKGVRDSMQRTLQAAQEAQKAEEDIAAREAEARAKKADAEGARDASIAASQARAAEKTLDSAARLQVAKDNLEIAKLEAEANRAKGQSFTPQLIKMRELEIEEAKVKKWDGKIQVVPALDGRSTTILDARTAGSK